MQLSQNAINYSLRELSKRAGILDFQKLLEANGFSFHYGDLDEIPSSRRSLVILSADPRRWDELKNLPPKQMEWIQADSHSLLRLPVLFRGNRKTKSTTFAEITDPGSLVFHVDLLATTFFMLSRWEEIKPSKTDRHDRFSAKQSLSFRQDFLDQPILDQYAQAFSHWLKKCLHDWEPDKRKFEIHLSHDIDVLDTNTPWGTVIKRVGGDLMKRRSLRKALSSLRAFALPNFFPSMAWDAKGIDEITAISKKYGLKSTFFFMASKSGEPDNLYRPSSSFVRNTVSRLKGEGFEIGFHPGYHTYNDFDELIAQKETFEACFGVKRYGVRQHYLRFETPGTWARMEKAGFIYDMTMTYADAEGFRCGTCHPFKVFDFQQDRELDLIEIPLIVMDATLQDYRALDPQDVQKRVLELAQRCKDVGGTFTLLWHNNRLFSEKWGWIRTYRDTVKKLSELVTREPENNGPEIAGAPNR